MSSFRQIKRSLTTNSGYAFADRLKKTRLIGAIESQPSYLEFRMHENIIEYKNKHAIINEQKILKFGKNKVMKTLKKEFLRNKKIISLLVSKGNFKERLIIDCLGTQ